MIATSANTANDVGRWGANGGDIRARVALLRERIREGQDSRRLTSNQARGDLRGLQTISERETRMRRPNGRLNSRDEAYIQAQLDSLTQSIRSQ